VTLHWLLGAARRARSIFTFFAACSCLTVLAAQAIGKELPHVALEREHNGQVVYVGTIDAGRQLVSVDYQGGVYVWDAQTLRQVTTRRRVPFPVKTAALLDARTLLVAGSMPQDLLAFVDLEEIAPPRVLGAAGGETVSISAPMADGKLRAAVATESMIRVVELDRTGTIIERLKISKTGASSISLSDDGRLLAIATNEPQLLLMDATTGATLWARSVDRTLTSLSIGTEAGVILGGYDNVIAFTIKRIDQFDLGTGRTVRQISTDPCSVFQVDVVDLTRGFAICGPAITDGLVHMSKRIRTSFRTWSLQSDREPVTVFVPQQAGPGALGYLPFRAGITFDPVAKRLFIGGGDGSLFAAHVPTNDRAASITRLAPVPQVALRFAIGSEPHKLLVVSNPIGRNGGSDDKRPRLRQTMRSVIGAAAADEHFTEEELEEAIDPEGTLTPLTMPNGLSSWDIDSGFSDGTTVAPLGYVLDVTPGTGKLRTQTLAVEAMAIPVGGHFEPTILAVSQLTTEEDFELVNRRLVSIDSITGLLKEGIRRSHEDGVRFNLSVCPSAVVPGNVRLSSDGRLLCTVCLALREGASPGSQDFLHPDYDLLTYWLSPSGQARPARIRFSGAPSRLEVSSDGSLAAVLTQTQTVKTDPAAPGIDSAYALTIIDTRKAKVLKTISGITEPPIGKALQFSPDTNRLYLALGQGIYRYDVGSDGLVPIDVRFERVGSSNISALAINHDGSLMAVARHSGITEVYQLADLARVGVIQHPGQTMHQIEFDTGPGQRLVAAAMAGGIELFDYGRGEKLVDFLSYEGGDWITVAPDGVFAASIGGELGVTVSDGRRAVGVDQLYDLYFRPETLRRRIADEIADGPVPDAIRHALSTPPPSVEVNLRAGASSGLVASIAIHDLGGGIGGLRAFHNGKLSQDIDATSLRRQARTREGSTLYVDIPLPVAAGPNEYVVAAMNADRSAQSRFAKVSLDRPNNRSVVRKAYVLMVGTNSFEQTTFPVLSLAEDSSRHLGATFRRILASVVGQQNVVVLDLVGEGSRFESVGRALRELEQRAAPDDIVALIITTHGKILSSGEMLAILRDTGADDTRALAATSLISSMNRIQALTQILVLDICHAGAVSEKVSAVYQDRFAVFASRAGIHVLASTSADEPALAAFNGTTPFAHFLIEGLQPPPTPTTGSRSLRNVANDAKSQVKATAARFGFIQVPTIYSFGKDLRFP
jgi:WD40 repeat protein